MRNDQEYRLRPDESSFGINVKRALWIDLEPPWNGLNLLVTNLKWCEIKKNYICLLKVDFHRFLTKIVFTGFLKNNYFHIFLSRTDFHQF